LKKKASMSSGERKELEKLRSERVKFVQVINKIKEEHITLKR